MEILGLLLLALMCLPLYASHLTDLIRATGDAIATARFGGCDCDDEDDEDDFPTN